MFVNLENVEELHSLLVHLRPFAVIQGHFLGIQNETINKSENGDRKPSEAQVYEHFPVQKNKGLRSLSHSTYHLEVLHNF